MLLCPFCFSGNLSDSSQRSGSLICNHCGAGFFEYEAVLDLGTDEEPDPDAPLNDDDEYFDGALGLYEASGGRH